MTHIQICKCLRYACPPPTGRSCLCSWAHLLRASPGLSRCEAQRSLWDAPRSTWTWIHKQSEMHRGHGGVGYVTATQTTTKGTWMGIIFNCPLAWSPSPQSLLIAIIPASPHCTSSSFSSHLFRYSSFLSAHSFREQKLQLPNPSLYLRYRVGQK